MTRPEESDVGSRSEEGLPAVRDLGRRRLLNRLLGGGLGALVAAIVYPIIRFISPPDVAEAATNTVQAGTRSELAAEGWMIFPFGSEPGILIEPEPGDLRAFSAVCTHLACTVQYRSDKKLIWCACHNGWYDLQGKNIAGPPPRPLTKFRVEARGDDVFVTRG